MAKKKPKNKKGNPVLSREEYKEMMEAINESGYFKNFDQVEPEFYYDPQEFERGGELQDLDQMTRTEVMNQMERYPILKGGQVVLGKPNDIKPELSSVRFINNPQFADYQEFAPDDPELLEGKKGLEMTKPSYVNLKKINQDSKFAPKGKSKIKRKSRGKKKKPFVEEFDYKNNKPAKGSIGRKSRKKFR